LGYEFSSNDPDQINEAADYLLTVPQNEVFAITGSPADLLLQGEVDAIVVHARNLVNILQVCECEDFVYSFPADGFVAYYDAMVIPTSAPNPDLAHAFIDYILDPNVNADLSNALGSGAPNEAAQPFINEDILSNGISYPNQEMVDSFLNDTLMIEETGQGIDIYVEAWNRVKAGLVN
jgi:spermidine/putrescine-binding protein